MLIARQKKAENLAEYLLYMWQVEDLLRALDLDESKITATLGSRFGSDPDTQKSVSDWYLNLAQMMRNEHKEQRGHLQINLNTQRELEEYHLYFLQKDLQYQVEYEKNLPLIADLRMREKAADTVSDIEVCLNALYLTLMLKIKGSPLSSTTADAIRQIGLLLRMLVLKIRAHESEEISQNNV